MKKCLFYLLVVLCALSFFSCGDDGKEGPRPDERWKQITGDYSGSNLKLNLNGAVLLGNTVKVEALSAGKITLTYTNLLPGVKEMKMDAILKDTKTDVSSVPRYDFEGNTKLTDDSRTVAVIGSIESGVLNLNMFVTVNSPIIGNWQLAPVYQGIEIGSDGYDLMNGCFFLSLASPDHQISFMGKTMTDKEFCSDVDRKVEMFLTATLKEIVFQPHGVVTFLYSKDGKEVPVSNLAGFYEKDKMIYLTLDIAGLIGILKETKADITPSGMEELLALARNGIPLVFEQKGDIFCTLRINKEMAVQMLPALKDALPVLLGLMADKPEAAALLKEIGKLAAGIPSFDTFQVGVNLERIR